MSYKGCIRARSELGRTPKLATLQKSAAALFGIGQGGIGNLPFGSEPTSLSSLAKSRFKLSNKAIILCFTFFAPYLHKIGLLLAFMWTLFLHSCIGLVGQQAQDGVYCPNDYMIKVKGPSHYVKCEDFDLYHENFNPRLLHEIDSRGLNGDGDRDVGVTKLKNIKSWTPKSNNEGN